MNLDPNNPFVRGRYDIRLVARRQRRLIWIFLASLITFFFSCLTPGFTTIAGNPLLELAITFLILGLNVLVIIGAILLMRSLRTAIPMLVLVSILMLVPLLSLIILLLENRRATIILRKVGIPVGFMGVKDEVVVRLLAPNLCRQCGYDLTGNVSGICPECGKAIQAGQVMPA